MSKEPFYFKSFDKVIGVATDEESLLSEMKRLINVDLGALDYHVKQGHIAEWLKYIGRGDLAQLVSGASTAGQAVKILEEAMVGWDHELTCPYCGYRGRVKEFTLVRPPWRFGKFIGRLLLCPKCGHRFRYFYPLSGGLTPYTIPKAKQEVKA